MHRRRLPDVPFFLLFLDFPAGFTCVCYCCHRHLSFSMFSFLQPPWYFSLFMGLFPAFLTDSVRRLCRYLLCNTVDVSSPCHDVSGVYRDILPIRTKPPCAALQSLPSFPPPTAGSHDCSICNIKINLACGKPLPCFSLLLPLFKGKTGKFIFRYTNRLPEPELCGL